MTAGHDLTIRPYRSTDLDAVIAIFLGTIREIAAKDYTPAQIDAWAQVDRAVWKSRRLSRPTWIAAIGDKPGGFADLEPNGHLDMMFVHPAHQGAGVATTLLATVEAAARAQKLLAIFTKASLTARPFFLKRGFRVVAEQFAERQGQRLTNFHMEKSLT